jgi:hypothetical protein
MRRITVLAAAAALVGAVTFAPALAPAGERAEAPIAAPDLLHHVQFYGPGPYYGGHGWDRRRDRQAWRHQDDRARIASAARGEAYRIQEEREHRRAWRSAHRWRHGYGPAYGFSPYRSW